MPPLPNTFQFSQASLQDFLDCPRRFHLRYRMALRWPAVEIEPIEAQERRMALGKAFHQLVQQHVVGVPAECIERSSAAKDMAPELADWWRNYLVYRPIELFGGERQGAVVRSEFTLEASSAGHRLVVRYDLLILLPEGRAVILDWKTSRRRGNDRDLVGRMQTRLYRYLLVEAGGALDSGRLIEPGQVEMVYWFPEFPDSPARFPYDSIAYADDRAYLSHLIDRIVATDDGDFEMTEDESRCRYCTYRSYCGRGQRAGTLEDVTAAWDLQELNDGLTINFDDVVEVEY